MYLSWNLHNMEWNNRVHVIVYVGRSFVFYSETSVTTAAETRAKFTFAANASTRLLPLLWASSCDAELTATLHSEQ